MMLKFVFESTHKTFFFSDQICAWIQWWAKSIREGNVQEYNVERYFSLGYQGVVSLEVPRLIVHPWLKNVTTIQISLVGSFCAEHQRTQFPLQCASQRPPQAQQWRLVFKKALSKLLNCCSWQRFLGKTVIFLVQKTTNGQRAAMSVMLSRADVFRIHHSLHDGAFLMRFAATLFLISFAKRWWWGYTC